MSYPLQTVLTVRDLRVNLARSHLMQKKREKERAEMRVAQKERSLIDFRLERKKREQQLYEDVKDQRLALTELEHFYLRLQWMHTCEIVYQKELQCAEKELAEAGKNMQQARLRYRQVVKKKEKLVEHQHVWQQTQRKVSARQADDANDDVLPQKNAI